MKDVVALAPPGSVAACLVARDAHDDLGEWIHHHLKLGISKIYVYDHASSPPMLPVVQSWVHAGAVQYTHFTSYNHPSGRPQLYGYDRCLQEHGNKHAWLAFFDVDEYLIFQTGLPVGLVGAALPVSGVFELGPLKGTSIAQALRLTGADIATLSPRLLPPPAFEGLHVVAGGAESDEFIRQSRDFATHWGGGFEALPGANHFTVLDPFTDPTHPLMIRAGKMAHRLALRPGFAQ
jgi:hypothetical protein